eukprot:178947_1
MDSTHTIQLAAMAIMGVIDVIGLFLINRYKKSRLSPPQQSWNSRRNAFWILIAFTVTISCLLDVYYPIDSTYMRPIKSYVFAFPLGLLDLYFSDTRGVPMKVIAGASLWCSTLILRNIMVDSWFGRPVHALIVLKTLTPITLFVEMFRYVCSLLGTGLLSDLLFSPMHRAAHSPKVYEYHHKTHHEYTNTLTALVLYHGNLLDDFLMPLTAAVGSFLYIVLLSLFGLEGQSISNLTAYLTVFNMMLSHAHDIRCARLLAPLPDEFNYVAYHYVHHVSPANNFGLTEPSDLIWDCLLGVKTIAKLDDLEKKHVGNAGDKKEQ